MRKHFPLIRALAKEKRKYVRERAYKECCRNPGFVKAMREGVWNVLHHNVPLTPYARRRLATQKTLLRTIAKRTTSAAKAKALLQRGGFLPLLAPLLPAIVGTAGQLVGSLLGKR